MSNALTRSTSHSAGTRRRGAMPIAILCVAALASIAVSCLAGSVGLNLAELLAVVGGTTDEAGSVTSELLQLRMNRTLCAFSVGAMLALSGVLMQAMLRNPLADPYVLGVSGGAAVGALAAMLLAGLGWATDLAALGGALAVALLLLTLAYRDVRGAGGEASSVNLLLTGVVIASGCGALITLMLSIAPDERLRGMVFWLVGDLAGAEARVLPWLLLAAVLVLSMRSARAINLLAMHAEGAAVLGVAVGRIRLMLFLFSALLTAAAVATAGSIGFVGLIVPHACRFLFGPDHRLLIPVAALAGGTFLVLADTASRIVLAPHQLPVGAVTALIGVPVFLFQLHRERRR